MIALVKDAITFQTFVPSALNSIDNRRALSEIVSAIRKNRSFFLSGHQKPDGDTVASELAMASLLRRLGKSVDSINAEAVPESLRFLPGAGRIQSSKKVRKHYDVAVIFECVDSHRMGDIIDLKKQCRTVINIDHHLMHSFFGHINLINVNASSNSEQLFYLFEKMNLAITKDEATSLYAGIMADTGRFQHSNTNSETLRIASKLVERGVDVSFLTEKMYGTRSLSAVKLLGRTLSNLRMISKNRIAFMKVSQSDFRRTGSTEDETEEIVNYGLQVPTVLISLLLRETQTRGWVKVSLRSRRGVNVCSLAQIFGGGGHKYASGCKIKGRLGDVSKSILRAAQKHLNHEKRPKSVC